MAESIGGFFASLDLKTDTAAFQRGESAIGGIASAIGGLLKGAAPIAALAESFNLMFSAASQQGQLLITGDILGMSADQITMWGNAITEAGGNANAFMESVKGMHKTLGALYAEGKTNEGMFIDLGMLFAGGRGPSIDKWMKESTNQQLKDLFNAFQKAPDKQKAQIWLNNILGQDAVRMSYYMRETGRTLPGMLGTGQSNIYADDADRRSALRSTAEMRNFYSDLKGIWDYMSDELIGDLGPTVHELNVFMRAHHDDIKNGIKLFMDFEEAVIADSPIGIVVNALRNAGKIKGKFGSREWFESLFEAGKGLAVSTVDPWKKVEEDINKILHVDVTVVDKTEAGIKAVGTGKILKSAADRVHQLRGEARH